MDDWKAQAKLLVEKCFTLANDKLSKHDRALVLLGIGKKLTIFVICLEGDSGRTLVRVLRVMDWVDTYWAHF